METFIKEFNFKDEDMHLCDDLIQYHNNSMEYKFEGRSIGANEKEVYMLYTHHHKIHLY